MNENPDAAPGLENELAQLVQALNALPPRVRQVFTLSQAYSYTVDKISESLGISQHRTRRFLRHSLTHVAETIPGIRLDTLFERRRLYLLQKQAVGSESQIILNAAPRIVTASAALAERLKREPQSVFNLAPRQFELLVAELLEDLGYRVETTSATRDGGRALLAYLETELGTFLCLVEAKKYRRDRKVGVELVRALYGTLNDAEANHAMLITTSSFTADAREFQHRHQFRLALRDFNDLERWIVRYGTGGNK